MQAARLHAYGKSLVIDDVPRPMPGPGQVVIRVEGAGFCHSDLHIISGDIQVLPRMPADRVVQAGLAGGTAHITALKTVKPEVSVSVSWWGNIRELREVLALAESGRLTPIPLEFWPLEKINEVYEHVKHGQVAGRAVLTPAS